MPVFASAGLAAYTTAAVAALAIVVTFGTTAITLRHQRALAEGERRSNQQADAYIRLLEYQHEDPGFGRLLPPEVASRLLAYGSEETNRALGSVRGARNDPEAFNRAVDALVGQIRMELRGTADKHPLDAVTRWQT